MDKKSYLVLSGIMIFLMITVADAMVPPCIVSSNQYNPYHGPMNPGDIMSVFYPSGMYDLWYAEIPLTVTGAADQDFTTWNWQKIQDIEIKAKKELHVHLGLKEEVSEPLEWIRGYEDSTTATETGSIRLYAGSKENSSGWAFVLCNTGAGPENCLVPERLTYYPGQPVLVWYRGLPSFDDDAWVGIIPTAIPHGSEEINDENDVSYQYIGKTGSGSLTFEAPEPGRWDLRMFDSDDSDIGKEICAVEILVIPAGTGDVTDDGIRINKLAFYPGETIEVWYLGSSSFYDDAWIGIIPSAVPHGSEEINDENDVSYQYIGKKGSGRLTFEALEPGWWDLRMFDSDDSDIGKEICSLSFTVL
ncbi:MAG: hypothetical protein JXA44_05075 [Methanospirillaceae archaeon]|nr:hypothetical protein [Methanospirillaceae archaeon]